MDAKQSDEQNPYGDTKEHPEDSTERIRRFVIKIKEVIEKCLKGRMTKEQMFQWLREKGVHPMLTYTVYRELRHQNQEFFKAYYLMACVNRQIERFNRQLVAYRVLQHQAKASAPTSGSSQGCDGSNPSSSGNSNAAAATYRTTTTHAATGPRALSATPLAVAVPGTALLANHRAAIPACQNLGALPGLSRGTVHEYAGRVTRWQAAQHGCHLQYSVPNGAWAVSHGPLVAGPSNAFMASSRPPLTQGGAQHRAEQRLPPADQGGARHLPLQQPVQHGGGSNDDPNRVLCLPPPSHGEEQLPLPSQEAPLALQRGEQQLLLGRQSYQSNGDWQEQTHQSEDGLLELEDAFTDLTKDESLAPLA